MREHPIPQDIVGYRFHIVGSMTLKQFAELAIGAILGFLIYLTNLPAPIKWPLVLLGGSLGVAAAFLPIAERPLDHWITTFFKTLYRPTKFYWKRSSKVPDLFMFEAGQDVMTKKDEIDLTPARRQRIKDYLDSVKSFSHDQDEFELEEQNRIQSILNTFEEVTPIEVEITKQAQKPDLKMEPRKLTKKIEISPQEKVDNNQETIVVYDKKKQSATNQNTTLLDTGQVAKSIEVPVAQATKVQNEKQNQEDQQTVIQQQQQAAYATSSDVKTDESAQNQKGAVFNAALPFPSKPDQPNKLVGMILTTKNELIPEAVIEIKDEQGRVVRAVKSNALGQFFISTALKNGSYDIVTNHSKYKFNPLEIELKNKVVEPIEIRSLN